MYRWMEGRGGVHVHVHVRVHVHGSRGPSVLYSLADGFVVDGDDLALGRLGTFDGPRVDVLVLGGGRVGGGGDGRRGGLGVVLGHDGWVVFLDDRCDALTHDVDGKKKGLWIE